MKVNILEIVSGDSAGIPIKCLNPDNDQPIDISSFLEIIFTARDNKKRIILEKKFTTGEIVYVTDGTDGELTILMEEKDLFNFKGVYDYDLQFSDSSNVETTPVISFIKVNEDVTI